MHNPIVIEHVDARAGGRLPSRAGTKWGGVVPYRYERGDHRYKHRWKNNYAGFGEWQGHVVGKCPNDISDATAEAILNQAVAEPDPFEEPGSLPRRLYGVYKGVIYEAVRTQPGSYHGYPWQARGGRSPLPLDLIETLRQMAETEGYGEDFDEWLDQHG